jgi:hypothetical protein
MKKLLFLLFIVTSLLYSWEISLFYSPAGILYKCNINEIDIDKHLQEDLQDICNSKKVSQDDADLWKRATISTLIDCISPKKVYIEHLHTTLEHHCNQFEICQDAPKQWTIDVLESFCYRCFGKASIATEKYREKVDSEEEYEESVFFDDNYNEFIPHEARAYLESSKV